MVGALNFVLFVVKIDCLIAIGWDMMREMGEPRDRRDRPGRPQCEQ